MRIFRVETPDGYGPYSISLKGTCTVDQRSLSYLLAEAHDYDNDRPIVFVEFPTSLIRNKDSLCGFESREGALWWFENFLDLLHENGFVLSEYEVDENTVHYGKTQVMYSKSSSELVARYALDTNASDALV